MLSVKVAFQNYANIKRVNLWKVFLELGQVKQASSSPSLKWVIQICLIVQTWPKQNYEKLMLYYHLFLLKYRWSELVKVCGLITKKGPFINTLMDTRISELRKTSDALNMSKLLIMPILNNFETQKFFFPLDLAPRRNIFCLKHIALAYLSWCIYWCKNKISPVYFAYLRIII